MNAPTATSPPAIATAPVADFDQYMAFVTELFGEELYAAHQSDADPEMTAALADCVEAGMMVWGHPLKFPSDV